MNLKRIIASNKQVPYQIRPRKKQYSHKKMNTKKQIMLRVLSKPNKPAMLNKMNKSR